MSKPPANILVVEDESAIAELIAINLRQNGWLPILARDGHEAEQVLQQRTPDLILLDWMLPGLSGVALARKWRANAKLRNVPIIMLTGRSDEFDKVEGLDAGADDYMTKPFSTQELLARVRAVLRRRAPEMAGDKLVVGNLSLDPETHRIMYGTTELKVGPTEFKLLQCLMKAPERVHTRVALLDKVWGDHVFIEERTVDVHIKRLRASLREAGAMVETVRGSGYRFTAKPVAEELTQ